MWFFLLLRQTTILFIFPFFSSGWSEANVPPFISLIWSLGDIFLSSPSRRKPFKYQDGKDITLVLTHPIILLPPSSYSPPQIQNCGENLETKFVFFLQGFCPHPIHWGSKFSPEISRLLERAKCIPDLYRIFNLSSHTLHSIWEMAAP